VRECGLLTCLNDQISVELAPRSRPASKASRVNGVCLGEKNLEDRIFPFTTWRSSARPGKQ
jgi:hypothetical protein